VERVSIGAASGWRRLYADREVVLEVSVGGGPRRLPSREPAELLDALS
jgi:hypothetical protein